MNLQSIWLRVLHVLLLGCPVAPFAAAGSTDKPEDAPPASVSIRDAFSTNAHGVDTKGTRYTMQPALAPLVDVDGESLLAIPIIADASKAYTLTVLSFVVRLSRDEYVLYYPLVSLINAEYQVQARLKPRYKFGFEGNVLHNEFAIPAGASWLLVHTSAERISWAKRNSIWKLHPRWRLPVVQIVGRSAIKGMTRVKPRWFGIYPLQNDNASWYIERGASDASIAKRGSLSAWNGNVQM